MLYGGRNTKFFYESKKVKRRRKQIECLKNDEGVWINDEDALRSMAASFFMKLYTKDGFIFLGFLLINAFPKLNELAL